ncbi:LacI family DNA-binding transcriptional regulator [Tropicimonas sp. TH_r6]|uniref:LacI family DNA-binding transcriptional regulator n=1 Tax=Tropicimonas sp. TH_r6 TaxID=3082085 RepID=UPI002953C237|nr:LacI family DNA-binding transcriptional regulator [Tropicimonas sp. TH_r6]MDV7143400.1 LacI family DNA-binding transcriptional regulator [Tropicimonas sp. TH_r6]
MATRVTAQMVAERAGVSQSAVSRVFTSGASASPKTADKVRKAAAELGYRPNVLARAMVSGRSRIIGLVVAYLENLFYPEVLEKLSGALQARGYHILVFLTSQTEREADEIVEEVLSYQVDGIILASAALSSDLASRCEAAGVPVLLFNRSQDVSGLNAVTTDNFAGGRKVGAFLLAGGHERIGYIAGSEAASTQRDREAGFRAALAEAGRDLASREIGDFDSDRSAEAARRMFSGPERTRPDAVFVAGDHMALIVMDVLRYELDLSVPGDVSVVGYDDVPSASWHAYNLTTVRQPAGLMVEKAVNALLEAIEAPESAEPKHEVVDAELILRGSARLPEGLTK